MKAPDIIAALLSVLLFACNIPGENKEVEVNYKEIGDSISAATFNHIKTALQNATAAGGPQAAIAYCHENAIGLTGTLASDSIRIFRVAEKYRNPVNKLTEGDKVVWKKYQQALANGDSIFALAKDNGAFVDYYKPIILQPMCLTCHGLPQNIPANVLHTIDSLYPGDLAKGFSAGDLRGIWHIQFMKRP